MTFSAIFVPRQKTKAEFDKPTVTLSKNGQSATTEVTLKNPKPTQIAYFKATASGCGTGKDESSVTKK